MQKMDEQTKERIRKMLRQKREEFEGKLLRTQKSFREEISTNNRESTKSHIAESITLSVNGNRLENLRKCIWNLNEAIERVNQGTYGVCLNCGEQIPLGRLAAIPWAKNCVLCKTFLSNGRVGAVS